MTRGLRNLPISFVGIAPHSLRWIAPDSAFLSEAGHKAFAPAASATRPALPRFPSFRDDPGHSLCHHRWDGAGQRDTDPAVQRSFPEDCGPEPIPRPNSHPEISQTADSQANPPDRTSPRSSAQGPFRSALQTDQLDLRFGFHSSGGLCPCGKPDLFALLSVGEIATGGCSC
jgi:hypothetical protein